MRSRLALVPAALVVAALAVGLLAWAGWLATGGRLYFVSTPSMGRTAPVGSLVIGRPPTSTTRLEVGQLIVFTPPGHTTDYVHRIDSLGPDGIRTRGALNAIADPWTISRRDIDALPVRIVPAVGWLYHWAGWLALGVATILMMLRATSERWRPWCVSLGASVALGIPMWISRPFVSGVLYGAERAHGQVTARLVSTGVFPVRFSPRGGAGVVAEPGQLVVVHGVPHRNEMVMSVRMSPALPWWAIAVIVAICLTPLYVAWREARREYEEDDADDGRDAYLSKSSPSISMALPRTSL